MTIPKLIIRIRNLNCGFRLLIFTTFVALIYKRPLKYCKNPQSANPQKKKQESAMIFRVCHKKLTDLQSNLLSSFATENKS